MSAETVKQPQWWLGVGLAVIVALAAGHAADFIGVHLMGFSKSPVSAIMMAIIIGMVIGNTISLSDPVRGGLKFCASTVLKIGIMFLGIRLSLVDAGMNTLLALPFVIIAILVGLTTVGLLGRSMGLSRQLSGLIAVGTSICGCTAIVATTPIIRANESEASYAIACITVFGVAAMFLYPILGHYLYPDSPALAGIFLGTSIHETAQVAGAGLMYQAQYNAPEALDIATVTKLVRNLCMIAVIPLIGILYGRELAAGSTEERPTWWSMVPWFIIGFAVMSAIRTMGELGDRPFGVLDPVQWEQAVTFMKHSAESCLLVAMAAVGVTSFFAGIRSIGMKPFMLGLFAALLVGSVTLLSISLFGDAVLEIVNGLST